MDSLEYQGPITAVHFKNTSIYAGAGPYLKRFNWRTSELESSTKIFNNNKIHGITSQTDKLVVWGGRSFAFSPNFEEYTASDWIISATFDSDGTIYILTAHNKVLIFKGEDNVSYKEFDQSILYSGTIVCCGDRILVASGTVLNGVVIWDLDTEKLIHNFTQHQGSIFDVTFSADCAYVASCSDDRCIMVWDVATGDLVAKGWGHTSRIWKLKFSNNNKFLYSISEDLTCRVWEFHGSELTCIDVLLGHSGRNVWAMDILETPTPLICTGGQDGGIKLWTKYMVDRREFTQPITSSAADNGELYKGFCKLKNTFVFTTTLGRVIVDRRGDRIVVDDNIGDYSIVKSIGEFIFVCSKSGTILVFDTMKNSYKVVDAKTSGTFSFCSGLIIEGNPCILLQTHDLNSPLVSIELSSGKATEIDTPLGQTITAAGYFEDNLYIGSRTGGLCYTRMEAVSWTKIDRLLNSKDAITSIISTDHLIIGSRSGSYGYFSGSLELMYENKLQRGSIETIQLQNNGDLIAYGFRKEHLFIWNLTHEYEVANEDCGGGHRTWSLTVDPNDEVCYDLSFVKASKLHRIIITKCKDVPTKTVVLKKTHGREIRGMEFHPSIENLVVTASEDTTVNVGFVEDNFLNVSSCLRKHASPPQTVHWSSDGKLLGTAGAKEEMIIWTLYMNKYLRPCATLPTTSAMPDLRIMDFDILSTQEGYLIACAYSDSTIRLWTYTGGIQLVTSGQYSDRCLLQVHFVTTPSGLFILTTSTDGTLLVYSLKLKLVKKHTVHQSGIRGSAINITEQGIHVYSGGEDNCLAGTLIDWDWNCSEIFKVPDAHAATITQVLVHQDSIYSTGPDQKICKWSLDGELVHSERTAISDTACLSAQNNKIIAAGLGVCTYSI